MEEVQPEVQAQSINSLLNSNSRRSTNPSSLLGFSFFISAQKKESETTNHWSSETGTLKFTEVQYVLLMSWILITRPTINRIKAPYDTAAFSSPHVGCTSAALWAKEWRGIHMTCFSLASNWKKYCNAHWCSSQLYSSEMFEMCVWMCFCKEQLCNLAEEPEKDVDEVWKRLASWCSTGAYHSWVKCRRNIFGALNRSQILFNISRLAKNHLQGVPDREEKAGMSTWRCLICQSSICWTQWCKCLSCHDRSWFAMKMGQFSIEPTVYSVYSLHRRSRMKILWQRRCRWDKCSKSLWKVIVFEVVKIVKSFRISLYVQWPWHLVKRPWKLCCTHPCHHGAPSLCRGVTGAEPGGRKKQNGKGISLTGLTYIGIGIYIYI